MKYIFYAVFTITPNMRRVPLPVLPKPNWPVVRHQEKRAITFEEHQKIIHREFKEQAAMAFVQ
jgi:hypothetical protein